MILEQDFRAQNTVSFVRELIDCIESLGGQKSRVWAEIKSNRYSIGNSVTHARNSRGAIR